MLGRAVITSRTTLSPNSTTDWISFRSSSSIRPSSAPAEMSASMFSAAVASSSSRLVVGKIDQRLEEARATPPPAGRAAPSRAAAARPAAAIAPSSGGTEAAARRRTSRPSCSHTATPVCRIIRPVHGWPSANQAKNRIASQTSSECLISEKIPAPCSVLSPIFSSSVSLKNFRRRQVARAQPQAFEIQHLHEGHDAQQRDRHECRRR